MEDQEKIDVQRWRQLQAREMTEATLQSELKRKAEHYGWRYYHTRDSRGSDRGFPDTVLVRENRLIFAELKTQKGRVKPDQAAWLADLALVMPTLIDGAPQPISVLVWRPIHLVDGSIDAALEHNDPNMRDKIPLHRRDQLVEHLQRALLDSHKEINL